MMGYLICNTKEKCRRTFSIYEFSRLYIRGLDIFGDKDTLEKWLNRKQMALGGTVPLTLLDTAEGFRMINDLLSQIEYGFYS
jgi:uncharacterized protein (DUF2384 family)